jgi:hypothetical protein
MLAPLVLAGQWAMRQTPRPAPSKGKHMRLRGPLVITSALGLAVLAVSLVAVWTSIDRLKDITAMAVKTTITLDPSIHETFAPPPADAVPTMTAREALDAFERRHVAIPGFVTAQLGLFTLPVGPDCGPECEHNNIVRGDMVYSWLNKLVWGFSSSVCPAGSDRPEWQCTQWDFIDANTGEYVAGLSPARQGMIPPAKTR